MLVILNVALLPLGIVALLASLEAGRNADNERRADLRIALIEASRKLNVQLASDIATMRVASNAIALGGSPEETCARLQAILEARSAVRTPFALFGIASEPLCTAHGFSVARPSTVTLDLAPRETLGPDSLDLIVPAQGGGAVAMVRYSALALRRFAQPVHLRGDQIIILADPTTATTVLDGGAPDTVASETVSGPIGLLGLTLTITAPPAPFSLPQRLLVFLPLLMWAAASLITFVLVDRLLIRPLGQLRAAVDSHKAGEALTPIIARTPAREIRELGADIAHAFDTQTRATREVHHRVKNNLQVVASLISLHTRAATSPEAAAAYAAIQRRVDALAIVHRSHYAELDTGGGIDLRRLVGEIAANLRANPEGIGATPPIAITAVPVTVTQDTAIAIGFLLTELIELSTRGDAEAPIAISIEADREPGKASIAIASNALKSGKAFDALLADRYARILEGLGRQLRAPIQRNPKTGEFSVEFAVLSPSIDRN